MTIDYDAAGRRTRLTLPNQVSTEYQYDPASRLTALIYRNALGPLGDLTYQYDRAGNRTRVDGSFTCTLLPDPVDSATCDAANRQLSFGPQTLTYDLNGNLTSDGVTTYTWDARNRLTALGGSSATAAFAYDPQGRRHTKTIDGAATHDLHDVLDVVTEVFRGVYEALGKSFSLDPRFIRPSDQLDELVKLDSWDLGTGTEKMEAWLADNFQITADRSRLRTVMDLLRLAQDYPKQ